MTGVKRGRGNLGAPSFPRAVSPPSSLPLLFRTPATQANQTVVNVFRGKDGNIRTCPYLWLIQRRAVNQMCERAANLSCKQAKISRRLHCYGRTSMCDHIP